MGGRNSVGYSGNLEVEGANSEVGRQGGRRDERAEGRRRSVIFPSEALAEYGERERRGSG